MNALFDVLLLPFGWLSPTWAVSVISLLAGVIALPIIGKMSDQDAIRRSKDRMWAGILELRLYKDFPGIVFGAQGRILRWLAVYQGHILRPVVVLLIPFLPLMIQLHFRYDFTGLAPGDTTIVTATFREASQASDPAVELQVDEGVVVDTPAVHAPQARQVSWRVRAVAPGRHELRIRSPEGEATKTLWVGPAKGVVSSERLGGGFWDWLLYPGEPLLPDAGPVERIDAPHPPQDLSFLGFSTDSILLFLILSLVSAFALKGVFGVEF